MSDPEIVRPGEPGHIKVVWEGRLVHIQATVDHAGLDRFRQQVEAIKAALETLDDPSAERRDVEG